MARLLAALGPALAALLAGCGSDHDDSCQRDCSWHDVTGESLIDACVAAAKGQYNVELCEPLSATTAPDAFNATFNTTAGSFKLKVQRAWAPRSADRFYNLMSKGYYDGSAFYRVVEGFVVQWGPAGQPALAQVYGNNGCLGQGSPPCLVAGSCFIVDDVKQSNRRGFVAMSADIKSDTCDCSCDETEPDICKSNVSDTALLAGSELFVNLVDNSKSLDAQGFAPFAEVVEGMDVVDAFFAGYGEVTCEAAMCEGGASKAHAGVPCSGPDLRRIYTQGSAYLHAQFPQLTTVLSTSIVQSSETLSVV